MSTPGDRSISAGRSESSRQREDDDRRLTKGQRETLRDKLPDAANLALGAMLFGQFAGDRPFSFRVAVGGVVVWTLLFGIGIPAGEKNRWPPPS